MVSVQHTGYLSSQPCLCKSYSKPILPPTGPSKNPLNIDQTPPNSFSFCPNSVLAVHFSASFLHCISAESSHNSVPLLLQRLGDPDPDFLQHLFLIGQSIPSINQSLRISFTSLPLSYVYINNFASEQPQDQPKLAPLFSSKPVHYFESNHPYRSP